MSSKVALITLIAIILLFVGFLFDVDYTTEDNEATRITRECKGTIMYVIDDFNRVRKVYDCGERE